MYDEGVYTEGMRAGYRLRVERETGKDSPLTWNDEETREGWAYRQWLAGRVFRVFAEQEKTYANIHDPRDVITVWDEVDDIGDCYLTPADEAEGIMEYSALTAASEHGFPGVVGCPEGTGLALDFKDPVVSAWVRTAGGSVHGEDPNGHVDVEFLNFAEAVMWATSGKPVDVSRVRFRDNTAGESFAGPVVLTVVHTPECKR